MLAAQAHSAASQLNKDPRRSATIDIGLEKGNLASTPIPAGTRPVLAGVANLINDRNALRLWRSVEDRLFPALRLAPYQQLLYYHLLCHAHLERRRSGSEES